MLIFKNLLRKMEFNSKNNKVITIGRSKKCDLCYDENTLSKVLITILWDDTQNLLKIIDGRDSSRPGTNGTWLYAAHSYEITDNTICKIGSSKIKITYQPN